MKGRKIHALVDTEGLPMRVVIHSAGMQDRDGAALVLNKIRNRFPWLQLVWADAGYHAHQVDTAVAKIPVLRLEIVKRSDDMKGFVVLPRRWVVERTFSWFGRNRRLAKDFENLAESLLAFVTLACIQIAIRRLARKLSFESGSKEATGAWPSFGGRLRGAVSAATHGRRVLVKRRRRVAAQAEPRAERAGGLIGCTAPSTPETTSGCRVQAVG